MMTSPLPILAAVLAMRPPSGHSRRSGSVDPAPLASANLNSSRTAPRMAAPLASANLKPSGDGLSDLTIEMSLLLSLDRALDLGDDPSVLSLRNAVAEGLTKKFQGITDENIKKRVERIWKILDQRLSLEVAMASLGIGTGFVEKIQSLNRDLEWELRR